MRSLFFFLITINLTAIGKVKCQEIKWNEAKNWQLYNLHSGKAFKLPIDSLSQYRSLVLNTGHHEIVW